MTLKFHKLSINYLITFSCMVLIPFILFGFFINFYYGQLLVEKTEEKMTETAIQVAKNVDQEIRSASILSSALIHNSEFQQACYSYSKSRTLGEAYTYQKDLDFHINNLFLYTSNFGSIYIFTNHNKTYEFLNYPSQSLMTDRTYLESLISKKRDSYVNRITIENDLFSRTKNRDRDTDPLVSLTIFPDEKVYGNEIVAIFFSYRLEGLKQIQRISSQERGIVISDGTGKILYSNLSEKQTEQILQQSSLTGKSNGEWIIATANLQSTDWKIIQASPESILLEPIHRLRTLFFLFMAGILLIFILYTMLFFHNIITPLNHLAESMDLVEQGAEDVQVDLNGPFEMQHLQGTFNRMILQVSRLTEEKQKNLEEKNHLELQALQYQINPHFIANTLNSIRLMAVVNKNEHIKNMTASLMRLINDSFRAEGNHITLKEEKENLSSYVHIMKVRFGNRIELRFLFPENMEHLKIRKMLLQPLVENSIIHGFNNGYMSGVILIQSKICNKCLYLRITDNGIGINSEKNDNIESIETPVRGFTSLGIESVNRRIHLNYGDEYGLTIKSLKGFYTSMSLKLPLISGEQNS